MSDQNITDKRNSYFGSIPHIADDELTNPYTYRLYGHYVRVGTCKESTKTTAIRTGMSERKVRECRMELDQRGYINTEQGVKANGDFGSVIVTINDVMEANVYWCKYVKGTPQEYVPRPLQWVLHHMQQGTAPHAGGTAQGADKEEQYKKNKKKNTDFPAAGAATRTRPRDAVFDAVVEHCFGTDPLNALEVQQLGGGRVAKVAKALRKAYDGVLDDQQLADELGQFAEAWAKTELTMPQHEDSLLPNFKKWRDENTRTPPAAVLQRPLRVRTSCDDPNCKNGYVKTEHGRELCPNCWQLPAQEQEKEKATA